MMNDSDNDSLLSDIVESESELSLEELKNNGRVIVKEERERGDPDVLKSESVASFEESINTPSKQTVEEEVEPGNNDSSERRGSSMSQTDSVHSTGEGGERQARRRRSRRDEEDENFLGAATLKERFENKAIESKKVVTSSPRALGGAGQDVTDGEERHSALSLKARFESKIKDNAPVKRNFVINRGGGAAKKFGASAPASNKCFVCTKTVYPMEKLEADGHVYHKPCFTCKTCGRTVGLGNYAALQGDIYCKPHLKQLFKLKGNYDEGFGRVQRKADWVKKDGDAKPSPAAEQAQETNGTAEEPAAAVNGDDVSDEGEE